MDYLEYTAFLRKQLSEQALYHRKALDFLPNGRIAFVRNDKYMKWYHRMDGERGIGRVIYRKNKSLAQDLARKKFHQEMADVLEEQVRCLDQFAEQAALIQAGSELSPAMLELGAIIKDAMTACIQYANSRVPGWRLSDRGQAVDVADSFSATDQGMETRAAVAAQGPDGPETSGAQSSVVSPSGAPDVSNEFCSLLKPQFLEQASWIIEWCKTPYRYNTYHLNDLNIRARCGLMVRSKSEAFIADWLFDHRIPFRYEPVVHIRGMEFNPDFVILIGPGQEVFWEHFGALGSETYRTDTKKKLNNYLDAGIYPSRDLIITCEETNRPIDLKQLEEQLLILCSKYRSAAPFSPAGDAPMPL